MKIKSINTMQAMQVNKILVTLVCSGKTTVIGSNNYKHLELTVTMPSLSRLKPFFMFLTPCRPISLLGGLSSFSKLLTMGVFFEIVLPAVKKNPLLVYTLISVTPYFS